MICEMNECDLTFGIKKHTIVNYEYWTMMEKVVVRCRDNSEPGIVGARTDKAMKGHSGVVLNKEGLLFQSGPSRVEPRDNNSRPYVWQQA